MLMQTDVKLVAESMPGPSSDSGRVRNYERVNQRRTALFDAILSLDTFGTTFLNHGSGDKSSANQAAVVDPTSFARLCIWHSEGIDQDFANGDLDLVKVAYLGNEHRFRDDGLLGLPMVPKLPGPTPQPRSRVRIL